MLRPLSNGPVRWHSLNNTRAKQMKPLLECRNITVAYPIADGILRLYGQGISFTLEDGGLLPRLAECRTEEEDRPRASTCSQTSLPRVGRADGRSRLLSNESSNALA